MAESIIKQQEEGFKKIPWPFPTKGILKDVDPVRVPPDYFVTGRNVVSSGGSLKKSFGWKRLGSFVLEASVELIDQLPLKDGTVKPVFACATEIYWFNTGTQTITPISRYDVGTCSVTNGSSTVTFSGTLLTKYVKPGDKLIEINGVPVDYTIASVTDTQVVLTTTYSGTTETNKPYKIRQIFSNQGHWNVDVFQGSMYFTNGVDSLLRWSGDSNFLEIVPGSPPIANFVRAFGSHLFLGFLTIGGNPQPWTVAWCDAANPDNWSSGDAAIRVLPEGSDWIVGMELLRNKLIVYRDRSINVCEYIGGIFVFSTTTALVGVGPLGSGAIANMLEDHVFLGPDNVYTFDGATLEDIGTLKVQKWIIQLIHPARIEAVRSLIVEEENLIYFFYPDVSAGGDWCNKSLVFDYSEESFLEGDAPNVTASGFFARFENKTIDQWNDVIDSVNVLIDSRTLLSLSPVVLLGDKDGKIYTIEGHNADTQTLDSFCESGFTDFGDSTRVKSLNRLYIDGSAPGTQIQIYIGAKLTPFGSILWYGPYLAPVEGSQKEYVDLRIPGKFFAYRIQVSGLDTFFTLRNAYVELSEEGER